ncbi:MAG: hypothetical protein ACTSU9_08210 [Promethearchaeota archaeon]
MLSFPLQLDDKEKLQWDTIQDSFDILDFCNDFDITYSPVEMNVGQGPDAGLVNDPEYLRLVESILDRAKEGFPMIASPKMLDRLLHAQIKDCYPAVFDHVDPDGSLYWPCKSYPEALKMNVLDYKSIGAAHKAATAKLNPTFFHGKGPGKCNGDCQWMQDCVTEFYGNAIAQGFFKSGLMKEIGVLLS